MMLQLGLCRAQMLFCRQFCEVAVLLQLHADDISKENSPKLLSVLLLERAIFFAHSDLDTVGL